MPMRILVADDHDFVCVGLKQTLLLEHTDATISTANRGEIALEMLADEDFDLVIVDLFMPGPVGGFHFIEAAFEASPDLPIIVLSASENTAHVRKSIGLGAMGFVSKSAPKHVLFAAIDSVLAGNIYAPKSSSLSLSEPHKFDFSSDLNVDSITDSLTRRQLDILGLMAKGLSNKLIARELSLSGNTVKVHVSAILRVLNVDNRTQAGLIGQKLDLANRSQLRPDSED